MTTQRIVPGVIVDSARPNLAKPVNFDLDNISGSGYAGSVPTAIAATVVAEESGNRIVHKTTITLTAHSVTMTDAGAAGSHGSVKIYDFPAGVITFLGATASLTLTAGAGGVADGAAVVAAVGTVTTATNNATLTTTEANIVPSTACTLTAGTMAAAATGAGVTVAAIDGTATAVDAFLNLAVPDADSSSSDTISVTGTVSFTWISNGDV